MKKAFYINIAILSIFFFISCGSPENILISVKAPLEVKKGQKFDIKITVKNENKTQQKLVSLDIGEQYLEGVALIESIPDYYEAMHVPIDNTMSYTYNKVIEPGSKVTITLKVKAMKTGDFKDDIDVCINTEYNFLSKPIRTIIE